jgi:hypothetical protein
MGGAALTASATPAGASARQLNCSRLLAAMNISTAAAGSVSSAVSDSHLPTPALSVNRVGRHPRYQARETRDEENDLPWLESTERQDAD